jgi:hypothetical protein
MVKFVEAGLLGNVDENDWSVVHESAGGDWPGLRILDRCVRRARGDSGLFFVLIRWLLGLLAGGTNREARNPTAQNRISPGRMLFLHRARATPVKITRDRNHRLEESRNRN